MRRKMLARAVHHKRSLKQVWQLGDVAGGSNFPRCQDYRVRTTVAEGRQVTTVCTDAPLQM